MKRVTLFTRAHCHLCEAALLVIQVVRARVGFDLEIVDIDDPAHERWLDEYDHHVPVIHIDGQEWSRHRLEETVFAAALLSAES